MSASSVGDNNHGMPADGMCCLCTMEDITVEDGNYVEYQSHPSMKWQPAQFELCVIQQLIETQFEQYINLVKKTDCQATLRRLLEKGPPIYVADKVALPLDDGDTHVCKLWFGADGQEHSAKLKGAVEGEARDKLWAELREFIIHEGREEGDEDDADT